MPIIVAPNRIETSELLGGFNPDASEAAVLPTETPDALNVLPDHGSGSPAAREGFARLDSEDWDDLPDTHWIRHLNYFERIDSGARERYLVAVLSDGSSDADNVQIWTYNLDDDTCERVDDETVAWNKPKAEHWYAVIQGTYYGGTRGHGMYSWNPTDGYLSDVDVPDVKELVDDIDDAVDTTTEFARDEAFKKRKRVEYDGDFYETARSIRFEKWDDENVYAPGDRVSRKTVWDSTSTYWKSFRCLKRHDASDADKAPGTGADWKLYWKKVKLGLPRDDDGELDPDWFILPGAGKGPVGIFHGSRLWVRRDDEDNWSRLQYSAPLKPEKDEDIADLTFDPVDWAPRDDIDGDGGGWLPQLSQSSGDAIRALASYNNQLIIAHRWSTHTLIGTDESTWTIRPISTEYGCTGPQAIVECEGLVYMLSPAGTLTMTDGSVVREVPGVQKVRKWLKARLDDLLLGEDDRNWQPTLQSYRKMVWITLPTNPDSNGAEEFDSQTLVYDPATESFWLTDLPILDSCVGPQMRADRMFFSAPYLGDGEGLPLIFRTTDDPGDELYADDDPTGGSEDTTDIEYSYRTAWMQFGSTHNDRRVRRTWALVDTNLAVTVKVYKDFNTSAVKTVARDFDGIRHREGLTLDGTAEAVALSVEGDAPATILGFGVDTEPIRTRFHRG